MADTKISAETPATSIAGNEAIPAAISSANKRLSPELLASVVAHPGYVASRWYCPPFTVAAGAAMTADKVMVYPFLVAQRMTISDLGLRITALSASGHVRCGIYASDSNKMPTGTALSSCIVATDTATAVSATLGANVSLTPGLYYFASQADNSTVACNSVPINGGPAVPAVLIGGAGLSVVSIGSASVASCYVFNQAYASGLPDLTGTTNPTVGTNTQCPAVFFKVTSVP